jgi:hypothetical protein
MPSVCYAKWLTYRWFIDDYDDLPINLLEMVLFQSKLLNSQWVARATASNNQQHHGDIK